MGEYWQVQPTVKKGKGGPDSSEVLVTSRAEVEVEGYEPPSRASE